MQIPALSSQTFTFIRLHNYFYSKVNVNKQQINNKNDLRIEYLLSEGSKSKSKKCFIQFKD